MQAIQTRYFGPGNVKGARIKAFAAAGSLTMGYNHALNLEQNHAAAARAFFEKMKWQNNVEKLVGGQLPNGDYTFVMTGRNDTNVAWEKPPAYSFVPYNPNNTEMKELAEALDIQNENELHILTKDGKILWIYTFKEKDGWFTEEHGSTIPTLEKTAHYWAKELQDKPSHA